MPQSTEKEPTHQSTKYYEHIQIDQSLWLRKIRAGDHICTGNIALHMRKVKHTAFSYSDKQELKQSTTAKGYNFYQLYKHCKHLVCTADEITSDVVTTHMTANNT